MLPSLAPYIMINNCLLTIRLPATPQRFSSFNYCVSYIFIHHGCMQVQTAQFLARQLTRLGFNPVEYHKALPPSVKEVYLQAFRSGNSRIVVCTDAAARGLDLPFVRHVIQADFASNVVQYLHR